MTIVDKRIKDKYTRVVKIGDKWNTYIQIDNQGFTIVEQTTKKRATWFADMAAIALEKLIKIECQKSINDIQSRSY